MEYYIFLVIVIIILKILFWTFYFYVRAQRIRQMRQLIIISSSNMATGGLQSYNDHCAILDHMEPTSTSNPTIATCPPPYSEVIKETSTLPPSYEQVVSTNDAHTILSATSTSITAHPLSRNQSQC